MKSEYLKTLWKLRFEKLKKCENEAAWSYQETLDDCLKVFGKDHEVIQFLLRLVAEEKKHAELAMEMITLCDRTHPECELF